jgi:hypothetical protein
MAAGAHQGIAWAHQTIRVGIYAARTLLEFAREAFVQAVEALLLGIAQVQVREQTPQRDANPAEKPILDAAEPAHETRQQAAWNTVSEQEIDVFLLHQPRYHGFRSHRNVIGLQYSATP